MSGASNAWAWFFANGYTIAKADAKWAVVPRTDNNTLPAQPTTMP
jgi:hypothetical protein